MPFRSTFRCASFAAACAALSVALARPSTAEAGGGPESLFLVVNVRSWSSLTVANHYVRLRSLPISNVFYVDWPYDNERIDGDLMRTKLLGPVLEEIGRRGIGDHIDTIVYSTDFPWAVDCTAETRGAQLSQYLAPIASLNGATFLYQDFFAKKYDFLLFDANKYFRPPAADGVPASHGFRSWYGWAKDGRLLEAGGDRYFLSTMLGITSGRGMATSDVVRNLTRSVGADYTRPTGTFYFTRNDDVRSKTRHDSYASAVAALATVGARGEVTFGVVPERRNDVIGAMLGTEQFSWRDSRSNLRPGAIGEHLTSTAGVMTAGAGQTPLTEWLLAGAAGSSGAVTEPYAIPQKFPTPYLHLHYARGCSLAEAYYQSVSGPYQLLIVGDPLCRPWADPPRVSIDGVTVNAVTTGSLTLRPSAVLQGPTQVVRFELFVDGLFYDSCRPGESIVFDTRLMPDGWHELRMMAVCEGPIETRGGLIVPITIRNHEQTIVFERVDAGPVRWGAPLKLRVKSADAVGIVVAQGSRTVAKIRGSEAEFTLEPQTLGLGPVTLQAAAFGRAGPMSNVLSAPLEFDVTTERRPPYREPTPTVHKPGMKLTQDNGEPRVLMDLTPERWLSDAGVQPGESFAASGFFTVDRDCEFQFQLRHRMKLTLLVDDVPVYDAERNESMLDYIPVGLLAGGHKLELRGTASDDRTLDVRFGFAGSHRVQPAAMTHSP